MKSTPELLHPSHPLSVHEQELALRFISQKHLTRYIIGKNDATQALAERFSITGIIDDYAQPNTQWQNIPLIKSSDTDKNSIVINCASSISPRSAEERLKGIGLNVIPYSVLCVCQNLPPPFFVQEFREDFAAHRQEWERLAESFQDEASRKTFSDIVSFRITGDYRFMKDYTVRFQAQYFDPVITVRPNEVLVDCGGYEGDTVLEFIKRYKTYKKIFMFEPSSDNFKRAQDNLRPHANIELIPSGVSDTPGTLSFDAEAGSASHIDTKGTSTISVETLDNYIKEPVTFIKMDIEGHELNALKGAQNHIKQDHPKLALAVYHHASDFRNIPKSVANIRKDYSMYLRHYSEGWSETVMYFIPKRD